ncbi:hypothetical protein ENBRE01_0411 [Enteropsectra breve]|nr:hypothetical protein ENBRE01_0411 [Enteropsectra breve]
MEFFRAEDFEPIFTISSVILNVSSLVENGIENDIKHLFLPCLVTTFGASVLANAYSPRFSFTLKSFAEFAVGFVLSIFLSRNRFILRMLGGLPTVSAILGNIKLIKKEDNDAVLFPYLAIKSIISIFLKKLVLRKSMTLKRSEIFNLIFTNAGLYLIRKYRLSEYCVILVVCGVMMFLKLKNLFSSNKKGIKEKKSSSLLSTPYKDMPRRKASLANQFANKES